MANIVITTSGNSIVIAFNDYSGAVDNTVKRSYAKTDIVEVEYGSDYVMVTMRDSHTHKSWMLTYDSAYPGSERFIVDTVEGVAPSSESDLFDKITALR